MAKINSDIAAQIVRDVAADVPMDKSKVKYGSKERAFRDEVAAEWEIFLAAHPDAQLEVPPDIDGLP